MQRRHFIHSLAGGALAACAPSVFAQAYPARPVHIINPFAAGGALDQLARLLAQRLGDTLGQPVVVENKTGPAATSARNTWPRALPTATRW